MLKQLFILLTVIILLCGCGSPSNNKNNKNDNKQTPTAGGILKIHSYNPDTLNPIFTQNKANEQMLRLVFDSLIKCDETQKPVPVLASNFDVSSDGLIWTITTKTGVKWHDGTDFSAYDVESTLQLIKNGEFNTIYAQNLQNVSKVTVLSSDTLEITLKTPQTNFINLLDIPMIKQTKTPSKDDFTPIGTGAYVYDGQANKIITLSSNKSWWGAEHTPYINTIEVHLLPDKNTSIFAYEAKEIDVVSTDMQNWGRYSGNSENKIVEYPSGNYNFIGQNLNNKYLSNKEIRIAIANAVNKKRIFDEVLLSHGRITETFISPAWWVYNAETTQYKFDPKLAREKIEALDIKPQNITIELLVCSENEIKCRVADIIKAGLKDVGINARLRLANWDEFNSLIEKGSYDMYLGEMNYSPEINPAYALKGLADFEPLLIDLQNQVNDEGRKKSFFALQNKFAEDLPQIPLYFDAAASLYNNRVSGDIKPLRTNMFNNISEWFIIKK